jgi:hypothetical protein
MNMSSKGASAETGGIVVDEATHTVTRTGIFGEGVRSMNIVERMALVMRDVEHVGKSGQNREQGYAFRPIDEFMNSLHTPLVKHEVVVTPKVLTRDSFERDRRNRQGEIVGVTRVVELLVEFTFHAPDGSTLVAVTAGEGADVADKATNKAMAGALKYAIMQTFMVPTRELQDGDADTPEIPSGSPQQHAQNAGQDAAVDAIAAKAQELGRDAVMHMLDEACEVLGQTRAALTKKWRDANNVGAATNLTDEDKVPTTELYRFVLTLAPYVQQARERAMQEPQPGSSSASTQEPDASTHEVGSQTSPGAGVLCTETDGAKVCTRAAGHDGDHEWWG